MYPKVFTLQQPGAGASEILNDSMNIMFAYCIESAYSDDVGQAIANSDIILPEAPREVLPLMTPSNLTADKKKEFQLIEGNQYLRSTVSDLSLAVDDLIIPWSELVLKEKIGAGTLVQIQL